MGKTTHQQRSEKAWLWIALLAVFSALLVAVGGTLLSRQTERVVTRPEGNGAGDRFRLLSHRIGALELLWEAALRDEAARLLDAGWDERSIRVAGIVQVSRLSPHLSDTSRAHHRPDRQDPQVTPALERFARKTPGEWILPDDIVAAGGGWLESPGRPLAWRQANGRTAVLLILDPLLLEKIVIAEIQRSDSPDPALLAAGTGGLEWRGPSGSRWMTAGNVPDSGNPDEVLRHFSRMGDWALGCYFPAHTVTTHSLPVLAGSLTLASMLAAAGILLARSQRRATRLAGQQVSFVNQVSHELRTPLTNLLLNTDLAIDGLQGDPAQMRRRLSLIREETSRLSRLVDNVSTFQRMERGAGDESRGKRDALELMDGVRLIFQPLLERKSIRCTFSTAAASGVPVEADPFSQILANLLSNVEKYAGEGATAAVVMTCSGGVLTVDVSDNGPGIPPDAVERVFLPFQRGGSRVDEGASGTGLGLAISRGLAGEMGGTLALIDQGKPGTTFRLTLPVAERGLPC